MWGLEGGGGGRGKKVKEEAEMSELNPQLNLLA